MRQADPGTDDQILALWQALRANPDLDARAAMEAIDQLLDRRLRRAADPQGGPASPAPGRPGGVPGALEPGSPGQHAVLADVLRALLAGDAG